MAFKFTKAIIDDHIKEINANVERLTDCTAGLRASFRNGYCGVDQINLADGKEGRCMRVVGTGTLRECEAIAIEWYANVLQNHLTTLWYKNQHDSLDEIIAANS